MRALLVIAVLALPSLGHAQAARKDPFSRAEHLVAHGRYDDALKSLANDKRPRALAISGRIHALRGERAEADASYEAIVSLNRRSALKGDGLWALAEAAAALGAYQDANATYARAVEASPKNAELELAWSDLFITKHNLRAAQTGVAHVLARDPNHARALERMARIELERGRDFALVESLLTRALRGDPELVAAYVTRAGMALRDEDLAGADAQLDAALKVNPHHLEALSVRAAVRFVANDDAGFQAAIATILGENPRYSRAYAIIATYADWEHRYPELVTLSDAALKLDPDDASAHATRGLNLLRIGRELEGLSALREAWKRDHYDEQTFNLLQLYERELSAYDTFDVFNARIRMPRNERALLEPYAVPLIQSALEEMGKRYGFSAKDAQVEFFQTPEQFACARPGCGSSACRGCASAT